MLIIIGFITSVFGLIFTDNLSEIKNVIQALGFAFYGGSTTAFFMLFVFSGPNKSWGGLNAEGRFMMICAGSFLVCGISTTLIHLKQIANMLGVM